MKQFKIRCSAIGKIMCNAKVKGELSQGAKTYLQEWYTGEHKEIHCRQVDKGHYVEQDLIDFMASQLGYGLCDKNIIPNEDDFFITNGCDVLLDGVIVDVKACWDIKSLHKHAIAPIDCDYNWQLLGYMHLYKRTKGIVFHGLMNTPADINYGVEVSYEHLPTKERWTAHYVNYDIALIKEVEGKVIKCREYLVEYDYLVKSRLGRIN